MKKILVKILTCVSCILVLASVIAVSAFAETVDLQFIIDHANPVYPYQINDPSYDTDKTPDIYIEAPRIPKTISMADWTPLYHGLGFVNYEYYNIATGKDGVLRSKIAILSLTQCSYDNDWTLDVSYFDDTYATYSYAYSLEYDRANGYWYSSYYPHLQIKSFNLEIYVKVYDDIMLDESMLSKGGFTVEYPYIGGDYGYNQGYALGSLKSDPDLWDTAYQAGYGDGYEAGETNAMEGSKIADVIKDMVFSIFEAPSVLIGGMLNFDLFGVNLFGLVKTLLTLVVVGVIVFVLIKFRA